MPLPRSLRPRAPRMRRSLLPPGCDQRRGCVGVHPPTRPGRGAMSGDMVDGPVVDGTPGDGPRGAEGTLEVERLSVRFQVDNSWIGRIRGRSGEITAVDDVSFTLQRGASLGIVGESGCGKSTMARAVVGLVKPDSGDIRYGGVRLGAKRSRRQRRLIQMVFQDPGSSLNPSMTPRRVLSELLRVHDMVPAGDIGDRCEELLDLVELPRRLIDARPRHLSGGQRQRIGIARALALEPEVLIADESVAALDVSVQASVLNLLADLRRRLGLMLLFVSHDLAVIRHVSDEVIVMYLGGIVEHSPAAQLFDVPRHPYTKALLASAPRLKQPTAAEPPIVGEPLSVLSVPAGCRFEPR
ncbi:MAG: ATP-binding cassette domain-containing protein, partial [Chloroflexi bacterium]|nr:ATP-binding cassette domain-containing protein [Chloroflexota bacterium]